MTLTLTLAVKIHADFGASLAPAGNNNARADFGGKYIILAHAQYSSTKPCAPWFPNPGLSQNNRPSAIFDTRNNFFMWNEI